MKKLIYTFILVLCGCNGLYPKEYEPYMKDHTGDFEYDRLCTSTACIEARKELIDYKLAQHETETPNTIAVDELTNGNFNTKSLNQDCFKTLSKLIDDNYIGCNVNIELPELSGEEKDYNTMSHGVYGLTINGKRVIVKNKKRPTIRQCGIEMFYNHSRIVSYCKTDQWEKNEDTRTYYKEMANDGILRTGLIRPSFSFNQENPTDKPKKCRTKSGACEIELRIIFDNSYAGRSLLETLWDNGNLSQGGDETDFKKIDFRISEETKERISKFLEDILFMVIRMKRHKL